MKKVFCALFTNLDLRVTKHNLKIPEEDFGKEKIISKKEFEKLFLKIKEGELRIGGNAGNAGIALNDLGYKVILSVPCRNEYIMKVLANYPNIYVFERRKEVNPIKGIKNHPSFVHLIFKRRNERAIYTYDEIAEKFWLDEDFWNNIEKAKYLFLSGFHLIKRKYYKEKIDFLIEKLKKAKKKNKLKIHLEFGYGKKTMLNAFERLLEENLLYSFSLDEEELSLYFKNDFSSLFKEFLKGRVNRILMHRKEFCIVASKFSFSKEKRIHFIANDYTTSLVLKRKKDLVLPKENAKILGKNLYYFPNFYSKNPLFRVGLGDRFSAVWFIKGI